MSEPSPVLFIRATDDPAGQIARAIVEFAAKPLEYPTPSGGTEKPDLPAALARALGTTEPPTAAALSDRLLEDPSLLSTILGMLSRPAGDPRAGDRPGGGDVHAGPLTRGGVVRGCVLEMIRQVGDRRGDFKLIVSLRTEYYGRLVNALRGAVCPTSTACASTFLPTWTCPRWSG